MPLKYNRTGATIDWVKSPAGRQLPMKSYQYDAVIDIMLAEPGLSLSEVGRRLNKSPSWMSWLTKSDAFRDIYDARRAQENQIVSDELNNALVKVARQSLDMELSFLALLSMPEANNRIVSSSLRKNLSARRTSLED